MLLFAVSILLCIAMFCALLTQSHLVLKKKITCKLEEKWHWATAEKLENLYIHLGSAFLRGIYHDTSANKSTQTLGQLCMSFLQEKGYGN